MAKKKKLYTKWWLKYKAQNGHILVGEVFNDPPEKVRISVHRKDNEENFELDFAMTKREAQVLLRGLSKTLDVIKWKKKKGGEK